MTTLEMNSDEFYDLCWEEYRELSLNGMVSATDRDIRDLYAKMAILIGEFNFAIANARHKVNVAKTSRDNIRRYQMLVVFDNEKALNQKQLRAEGSAAFVEAEELVNSKIVELEILQAKRDTCELIWQTLSRELTNRKIGN